LRKSDDFYLRKIAETKLLITIVSLWSIPDFQTQEMMTMMYRNFTDGNDIETAFRNAQNQMRQKYSSPFYWAGFVLVK